MKFDIFFFSGHQTQDQILRPTPETPRTSQHYGIERFKEGPHFGPPLYEKRRHSLGVFPVCATVARDDDDHQVVSISAEVFSYSSQKLNLLILEFTYRG